MSHRIAAHIHAYVIHRAALLGDQRGQGTVEYVGVVVTMALLLGAVATASKGWGGDLGGTFKDILKHAISLAGGSFLKGS